jgi:hypothetical protein
MHAEHKSLFCRVSAPPRGSLKADKFALEFHAKMYGAFEVEWGQLLHDTRERAQNVWAGPYFS